MIMSMQFLDAAWTLTDYVVDSSQQQLISRYFYPVAFTTVWYQTVLSCYGSHCNNSNTNTNNDSMNPCCTYDDDDDEERYLMLSA